MIRTYHDLIALPTFQERFEYCKVPGKVGEMTFGAKRWLNQVFYKSDFWRDEIRSEVISRDLGCDLAMSGYGIGEYIIVHHLNPITEKDIEERSDFLIDPTYMVCVSLGTHNAIHYGDFSNVPKYFPTVRSPGDTCPWRK